MVIERFPSLSCLCSGSFTCKSVTRGCKLRGKTPEKKRSPDKLRIEKEKLKIKEKQKEEREKEKEKEKKGAMMWTRLTSHVSGKDPRK